MLTEAYCEFLQCHERVKRLRPKYSDHIFSIFISTNGMLILRYLCPQTSNSRYCWYCLRSKLASDLKQEYWLTREMHLDLIERFRLKYQNGITSCWFWWGGKMPILYNSRRCNGCWMIERGCDIDCRNFDIQKEYLIWSRKVMHHFWSKCIQKDFEVVFDANFPIFAFPKLEKNIC